MNLDPIVIRYRLTCALDQAFNTYIRRMPEWWHPQYTANADTFTGDAELANGGRALLEGR